MRDVYPTCPIVLGQGLYYCFIEYTYDYTCRQSMARNKMFRKQLFRIFALPYLLIQYLWSHRFALYNAKTSSQQKIVNFAYFHCSLSTIVHISVLLVHIVQIVQFGRPPLKGSHDLAVKPVVVVVVVAQTIIPKKEGQKHLC
jgi:hypothetical protein